MWRRGRRGRGSIRFSLMKIHEKIHNQRYGLECSLKLSLVSFFLWFYFAILIDVCES